MRQRRLSFLGGVIDLRSQLCNPGSIVGKDAEHLGDINSRLPGPQDFLRERREPGEGNQDKPWQPDHREIRVGLPETIQQFLLGR